jgi:hypothetical protein
MVARNRTLEVIMRQIVLTAAAAFVAGGIATGAALSMAQPAPPPTGGPELMPPRPGMAGWGPHGMRDHADGRMGQMRNFALVYRQADRSLAPADVQKIAEAYLLWNGNHTWKITDVVATADGLVGFSVTTAEGAVVAKFTMDPHTARVQRVA